jgi:hypothetical protein
MRPLPPVTARAIGGTAVEGWHQRGSWVRWPLLAVVVGGLVLGCVLVFPRLLYPPLTTTELQARGVRDPKDQVQLQDGRLKLQNDVRTTLLQALGGAVVAAGAYVTWKQLQHNIQSSREAHDLERQGQITERFTRAIDQLGNDKGQVDVTLGGIYALELLTECRWLAC